MDSYLSRMVKDVVGMVEKYLVPSLWDLSADRVVEVLVRLGPGEIFLIKHGSLYQNKDGKDHPLMFHGPYQPINVCEEEVIFPMHAQALALNYRTQELRLCGRFPVCLGEQVIILTPTHGIMRQRTGEYVIYTWIGPDQLSRVVLSGKIPQILAVNDTHLLYRHERKIGAINLRTALVDCPTNVICIGMVILTVSFGVAYLYRLPTGQLIRKFPILGRYYLYAQHGRYYLVGTQFTTAHRTYHFYE